MTRRFGWALVAVAAVGMSLAHVSDVQARHRRGGGSDGGYGNEGGGSFGGAHASGGGSSGGARAGGGGHAGGARGGGGGMRGGGGRR
jgi:hypothetical protein